MHVTAPIVIASLPERFLASYDRADREGDYLTRIRLTRVEATRLVDYLALAPTDHTAGRLFWDGDVLVYTDLHPDESTTVIRYEADAEGLLGDTEKHHACGATDTNEDPGETGRTIGKVSPVIGTVP